MSKSHLRFCLGPFLVLITFTSIKANAFDPTSLASGFSAGSSILGGNSNLDDLSSLGFSMADLMGELDPTANDEQGTNDAVKRIEDLDHKARELRWSNQEVRESLQMDLHSARSLQDKITALKNMIAASKTIAALMQIRPKAGDHVAQIQEIKINSMVLEELQSMHRDETLARVNEQASNNARAIYVQHILDTEGNGFASGGKE